MTVQSAPATQDELLSEWRKKASSGPVAKDAPKVDIEIVKRPMI